MATIPPIQPLDNGSTDEPTAVLRGASPVRTAAAIAAAAAVFLLVVVIAGVGRLDPDVSFLEDALGPEKAEAPMERTPAPGVDVRINPEGYTVSHWGASVSVVAEDVGGAKWRNHVHGVTRETEFGSETIVVDGARTEKFLTVTERQGEKTWRWKLATRLVPRLGNDGAVSFADSRTNHVTSLVIDPVQILDRSGKEITPEGLSWELEKADSGWWLTLDLDDSELPLPYVIDPAVTYRLAQATSNTGAGANNVVLTMPAGVVQKDLIVASLAIRGGSGVTVATPAGWTNLRNTNNGTGVRLATFYRIAGASEPATYTFTFSNSQRAVGGISLFYGVKSSGVLDVNGATTTGNSATATANSITTTAANSVALAFYAIGRESAYSQPTGWTELYDMQQASMTPANRSTVGADYKLMPTAGATNNAASTVSTGLWVAHQAAFLVDNVNPTGSVNDPGSPLRGTIVLGGNASDVDSNIASVQFQRSPANLNTWTNIGAADTSAPYTASFDTTGVTDGLYDLRVVVTDTAANVLNSTVIQDRRIDNTAPAAAATFPTASTYSTAGWNAGCGTTGLCGTASDGGSGVQGVEISVRQGTGNYWSAGSFSSGAEVWNATTYATGNWSYAFAAASFPADGSYTVRVRSTDVAGNVQTPVSTTFTIDRTPPQTTIDSNPSNPSGSASATFTFSSSEGSSTFQCRIDGGAWGTCTSGHNYPSLADGSHTFEVRATDSVGNQDASAASYTWLVDTTAPTSTTTFPAASGEYNLAGWNAGCATSGLCGTYGDGTGSGVAQVQVSLRRGAGNYWNGTAFASGAEVWNTATLVAGNWSYAFPASSFPADDSYTVRVRAVDAVSNTQTPASRTFTYDTTNPSALFTFPAASGNYTTAGWNAGCATSGLCGTHSDAGSGVQSVQVSLRRVSTGNYWNGTAFSSGSEVFQVATLVGGNWSYAFAAANFPADGDYTVHVRATDDAGNTETGPSRTFKIDNTTPTSTTTFPASSGIYSTAGWNAGCGTIGLCGTHGDGAGSGVAQVQVSLRQGTGNYWNGTGFASGSEVWNTTSLAGGNWSYAFAAASFPADGSYTVRVRSTDVAGNVETPNSRTFTIDRTAPQTTIDSSPLNPTSATGATFNFSSSEGSSTFQCRIDGGAWGACTSPQNYSSLSDGSHTFDVRATDQAGNQDASAASYTWLVDTTAPTSTATFPVASGSYTAAEWNAGCGTNGLCGTYGDGTGSGVADVEVSIRQGTGNYWNGTGFSSGSEVWNDATIGGGNWSYTFPAGSFPADGSYTVRVRAIDAVANTQTPTSRTFTFDATSPSAAVDFPQASEDYNAAGWDAGCATSGLCGTYSDATSGVAEVEVSIRRGTGNYWNGTGFSSGSEVWNDATIAGGDWEYALDAADFPADGNYTVRLRATDVAGNTAAPSNLTFTYDTTAPQTTIDSGPDNPTTSTDPSFAFSSSEAGSTFECRRDGGAWSACTSPKDYTSLADGSHTFDVRATDTAGNTDASAASMTWVIDTVAPSSTAAFPVAPGNYTVAEWNAGCTTSGLCGTYSDGSGSGVVDVEISIRQGSGDYWDGTGFTSATEVWNDATLAAGDWEYGFDAANFPADGSYTVRVRALDDAGNTETASSRTFDFDATEPETTIDSTQADPTNSPNATFDFSSNEPGSTFECSLDGGAWTACLSPESYLGLSDGSHSFDVRATDTAGNTDGNPATVFWNIDTTAPSSTASFPSAGGSYTTAEWNAGCATSGLCGTYSDGSGSGVVDVEISIRQGSGDYWDGTGFSSATEVWNDATIAGGDWEYGFGAAGFPADGNYTVRVRATDDAGNTQSPSTRTFAYDATLPSSTTSFPADAGRYNAAGWDAGCDDPGLCGTYGDGTGTGVAEVEVSVRRGTGNYWNGTGFSSATEVWNDATIAGGDWEYALDAADLPADGNYTVRVRALDVAGNVESASSRTFTYDTTAPQTTIDSSPSNPTGSNGATFNFSSSEGSSTYQCRIDGGAWGACTSPQNYSSLADGSHTFDVRATDEAGNTDSSPASFTWLVDTTAPSSTTSFPASAGEYNAAGWDAGCATAGLCGTYGDGSGSGVADVEVSVRRGTGNYWNGTGFSSATEVWNDATLAAGSWSYPLDASDFPADGTYTVRVRATDAVGNAQTPSSRSFVVDTTDPSALFSFPAAGGEYSTSGWNAGCGTVGLCGSHSDSGSGVAEVEVSVRQGTGNYWDGDSFDAASETYFTANLAGGNWSLAFPAANFPADGQYTVHVRATDDAGNTEGGPSRTFRIDDTDPSALYSFPAAGAAYNAAGWNAGCATDGACGTHSDSGSGVADVEVSLKRVATDLYWDGDSFDAASETYVAATLAGGNWSFAFPAAGFPADGSYTLHVRATDDAGNTEGGPVRTFTFDTAAPQTTLDSSPSHPTSSTSADFDFSSSEGGSTFECRIDGGAWGACTSPKNYSSLADGSHTFNVRATDQAGNTDASPSSFTWTVDTTAPSSTTSFPSASGEYNVAGWNAGCATSGLCGTYGDGPVGSGVDSVEASIRRDSTGLYWNGASFSAGSETWANAALASGDWSRAFPASNFPADGAYTVRVRATDEAGNAQTPTSRTFTFDGTAPTGSLTTPANGAALRGASVAVSSDSADAGSGVASAEFQRRPAGGGAWTTIGTDANAPYSVNWNTTALSDGDYDLRVVTTDDAGNTFNSATRTVTVDNTAPSSATLDTLPDAVRNGQQLTGSAADAGSGVDSLTYLYCEGTSCTPSTPIGSSSTGPSYGVTWSSQPADGDVRVVVRATDEAGNTLDSAVQTVLVDNTNPTGSLTAPANGAELAGTVAVSSDSADSGSGVASAEFQRRPAGGGAWTTIGTDANAPYSVNWNTTALSDGDYDLRVVTTDDAGNTFNSATRTVTVDNTAPTVALTAPTGFVNGAAPDPFTATATTPDGDVDQVEFFRCSDASANCGGGSWVSLGVDSNAPYTASWPIDSDGNRALRAVATDGSGNTGSDVVNVTVDRTNPTGSLTAPANGAFVTGTLAVDSSSADAGSGVDSAEFQRRPAGGGAWTTIGTDANAPYSVSWNTSALSDGDYDLRVVTTDDAGNSFTSASRTVTVDNSAPSAPNVTLSESSPFAHVSGSEIFVNTGQSGTYDVEATSSDAHSGIDKVRFPGPTDDSTGPYEVSYDLDDLSGAQTVTAFNGVGLTASSLFTVTPDTAAPAGGSVSYSNGYDADGDVTIVVDSGTDALSGVAPGTAVLERRTAALSDGSCDAFAGPWTAVTSPDAVASGLCAQYRYRVSDRVGNEAVHTSGNVVKVDLVDPSAPALTLDESSPYAHVSGTEIFLNTDEAGTFEAEASASDAVSGIAKIAFPNGVDDTSAPYAATYDFDDLLGFQTVTAHDRAGNTADSQFNVREDVTAPSTTDDTGAIGSSWKTAPVTVTLTPNDARSGVAATYYTTDGSIPTTSSPEGTSVVLTADGVYTIRYFSIDNVGNVEPVRTAFATIRIDKTNPAAPVISLNESTPFAHVSGGEIFVNTGHTATFGVSATSSDAGSGIDKIVFPNGVEDSSSPYSATYDLDDLSGSQTVTAHDAAGLTASDTFMVTPDTAAPTGGSVSYPDGYDVDGVVTISANGGSDAISGLDSGSGVLERRTSVLALGVCAPFVGGWSAVTSPDTVASGTCVRYRYRISDRVGNEAIYTLPTNTVKVDLVAPQTTVDVAPSNPSGDASPSFDFSSNEGDATFECRIDGGAWSACASPKSYAGLTDGSHTFQVRATDSAGLTDPTPASHTWTVDTAAPNTTLDEVPADPSADDAPSLEFSASEPGSTFECKVDTGAWTACSSPETIGLLSDGSHTFSVRATDAAGNVDATPAAHTWTVDTVAPESSFTVVPADPSNGSTPNFEFSANEPGSTFQCRVDSGAWAACTSPATTAPLADGSHTFSVRATDAAGNQESTPESYTWLVDAGAPSVQITQPSGAVNASDADPYTVTATTPDGDVTSVELFRCSDASAACGTGSWVSLGTDATAPYEGSWPLDADGNRALRAVATDAASNTGADAIDVTIDRTVPATTIDSGPADPSASAGANFTFSSSEPGASFECRLDGGAWGPCASPKSYTSLAEGNHTFQVRAGDAAGNIDPTPASRTWTVDTVAPQTTIDVAPTHPSADAAPDFEFSANEPGSTFECRLDGGAWSACTSPKSYAGLADGSHTFQVRATDPAGNVDGTPATHTWTIDATAPGGGLADPGQFLRGTVTLSASPSDIGAGVQSVDFQISPANADTWMSVGTDTTDPYSAGWNTTGAADGLYDLRIVVTDNVGNSSASTEIEDRLIDNTAPGATLNDPGAYLRGTVALTSNASDAGSGVASVAYQRSLAGVGAWTSVAPSWNTTTVADGLYDLRVIVVDNAGNSTTSPVLGNRRVDNTKPSISSSVPSDGTTVASAAALQISAGEDVAGIVNAVLDGSPAPAPTVVGNLVIYTQAFGPGPHTLAGELEDLAGNRQPIRIHFTAWSGATVDYPFIEKNSMPATPMSLRSPSDTTTVTVPAGAWSGAPASDWLVLRLDPQPATGVSGGFQSASEVLNVTAYWALNGGNVTSFDLPLEIEVDNTTSNVIPATFENGAWRTIAEMPGSSLPAAWSDGFERDGTNIRIHTRHLSIFTLLKDVQAPTVPGGFKGVLSGQNFSLSWTAASDNSGLVSAYRVYANGVLVKTVDGAARTAAMGVFKPIDKRGFQVAAVDEAGNAGAKTKVLKIVPKLAKLKMTAAMKALKTRGFKVGRISYKASKAVPKGKVIKGSVGGLQPAGAKIGLVVSKGKPKARRASVPTPPVSPGTTTPPTTFPPSSFVPPSGPVAVVPPPASPPAPTPAATDESSVSSGIPSLTRAPAQTSAGIKELRQELGFGLLVAAFSVAVGSGLRARRSNLGSGDQPSDELFWDARLLRSLGRALRRVFRLG